MIYYAGIGSRTTPSDVLKTMRELASRFAVLGFTLRSGGADGADSAFEAGCDFAGGEKEIFLPWMGFNAHVSGRYEIPETAYTLSAKFHPNWTNLNVAVRSLMARNVQQVAGENLDNPSTFVVCWTPDGCESHESRSSSTGGTGQAISIASSIDIPVFNLRNPETIDKLEEFLRTLE